MEVVSAEENLLNENDRVPIQNYFIGWQCRVRELALRSEEGRPNGGMRPKISLKNGKRRNLNTDTIILGGGCFWCIEALFKELDGVINIVSGYSGGNSKNPTYEEICTGKTGHAEVCEIEYDKNKISLE